MTFFDRLAERDMVRPALWMAVVWGLAEAVASLAPSLLPRGGSVWGVLADRAIVSLIAGAVLAVIAVRAKHRSAIGFGALAAVADIGFVAVSTLASTARRAALSHRFSLPSTGSLVQSTLSRVLTAACFLAGLALIAWLTRERGAVTRASGLAMLGLGGGAETCLAWWAAGLLVAYDVARLVVLLIPRTPGGQSARMSLLSGVSVLLPPVVAAAAAYLGVTRWRAPRASWVALVGSLVIVLLGQLLTLVAFIHGSVASALLGPVLQIAVTVLVPAVGVAVAPRHHIAG